MWIVKANCIRKPPRFDFGVPSGVYMCRWGAHWETWGLLNLLHLSRKYQKDMSREGAERDWHWLGHSKVWTWRLLRQTGAISTTVKLRWCPRKFSKFFSPPRLFKYLFLQQSKDVNTSPNNSSCKQIISFWFAMTLHNGSGVLSIWKNHQKKNCNSYNFNDKMALWEKIPGKMTEETEPRWL